MTENSTSCDESLFSNDKGNDGDDDDKNAKNTNDDDDHHQNLQHWWESWSEAHQRTCHARNALYATPDQVLEYTEANAKGDSHDNIHRKDGDDALIYWNLPASRNVTEWHYTTSGSTAPTTAGDRSITGSSTSCSYHRDERVQRMIDSVVSKLGKADNNVICRTTATTITTPTKQSTSVGYLQSFTQTVLSPFSPIMSVLRTPSRPRRPSPPPQFMSEAEDDYAKKDWDAILAQQNEEEENYDAARRYYDSTNADNNNNNNFKNNFNTKNSSNITWDTPVLNMSLTLECLEILQEALAESPPPSGSCFPKIISRQRRISRGSSLAAAAGESWKDWIKSILQNTNDTTKTNIRLDRLSDVEADFVLECLAAMGALVIIPAAAPTPAEHAAAVVGVPRQDLVVLAPRSAADHNNMDDIDEYHQVLASWWELTTAQESLEARRREWSAMADTWAKRALHEKKTTKQQRAGLVSLQIHKLFLQRLEQSDGMLLNLEQSRHTLEESWHQRQVVSALQASATTLSRLRQSSHATSIDQVDELMQAHRDELDHVNDMQKVLVGNNDYDDEDLLKELEGLTLEGDGDDLAAANTGGGSSGAASAAKSSDADVVADADADADGSSSAAPANKSDASRTPLIAVKLPDSTTLNPPPNKSSPQESNNQKVLLPG